MLERRPGSPSILDYRTAPATLANLYRLVGLRALRLALVQCKELGAGCPARDLERALELLPSCYHSIHAKGGPHFPRPSQEFEAWQRYRGFVTGRYYLPTRRYVERVLRASSPFRSWRFERLIGCSGKCEESEATDSDGGAGSGARSGAGGGIAGDRGA